MLLQGLRWRVGDGRKIRVWGSPWLSTLVTFKVLNRNPFLARSFRVYDLINPETRMWEKEVLESLFLPRDIKEILKIPLSTPRAEDIIIWHNSKSGEYTVSFVYHMGVDYMVREHQSKGWL